MQIIPTSHQSIKYIDEYEDYPDSFFHDQFDESSKIEEVGNCIWQVISSIIPFVSISLTASFIKLMVLVITEKFHCGQMSDFLTGVIGFTLLFLNSERLELFLPLLLYFLQSFALISSNLIRNNSKGFLCTLFTILFIIICQFLMDNDDFLMTRGSLMIAAMKQISLSFDIDASASKDDNKINYNLAVLQIPSFFSQFAFVFDPTTLIFGPFITYAQFLEMKCNLRQELREFNYKFFLRLLHSFWHLIIALFFLLLSTCFIDVDILSSFYFIPFWLVQFTKALAFRFSHYFVCYFATSIALIGGASYSLEIARWTSIEWPGSLAQVASFWNIPMHSFLHICRSRKLLSNGFVTLSAILITFAISSSLHVLISILILIYFHLGT